MFALASVVACLSPASTHTHEGPSLPVTQIFQFPLGGYVEALTFRPNGKLLGNLLAPEASIYQFDVLERCARKVTTVPNINGLYGITETTPAVSYTHLTLPTKRIV